SYSTTRSRPTRNAKRETHDCLVLGRLITSTPEDTIMKRSADDVEFRDFIESYSVTKKELDVIVLMPELSVPEVKRYLRDRDPTRKNATLQRAQAKSVVTRSRVPALAT